MYLFLLREFLSVRGGGFERMVLSSRVAEYFPQRFQEALYSTLSA